MKIKSLQELKNWNNNPTKIKPIVMEWFYDEFFKILQNSEFDNALSLYDTFIEFTMICEKLNLKDAIYRVQLNLGWYADRGLPDMDNLKKFYKKNNINKFI